MALTKAPYTPARAAGPDAGELSSQHRLLARSLAQLPLPPHQPAQLRYRIEGRGDPASVVVWEGQSERLREPSFQVSSSWPAPYEGQLFRVLWEVVTPQGALPVTPNPYAALGLSRNPFHAEPLPDSPANWAGVPDKLWLERGYSVAPSPGQRQLVQLLGVKGAGKSSHLAHWRSQQPGPAHYYPPTGAARWQRPPLADICYWDEACRIPAPLLHWALWQAGRRGLTVCVGTHRDLSAQARRYGLSVHTIHLSGISAAEIENWASKRIRQAQLARTDFAIPPELARELAQEADGSWREVATRLHIWTANRATERTGGTL